MTQRIQRQDDFTINCKKKLWEKFCNLKTPNNRLEEIYLKAISKCFSMDNTKKSYKLIAEVKTFKMSKSYANTIDKKPNAKSKLDLQALLPGTQRTSCIGQRNGFMLTR